MNVAESISVLFTINISAVIFGAGIVYNKVNALEKKIDKVDMHGEQIASINARINSLEKSMQ